jgi:hypothetical protein
LNPLLSRREVERYSFPSDACYTTSEGTSHIALHLDLVPFRIFIHCGEDRTVDCPLICFSNQLFFMMEGVNVPFIDASRALCTFAEAEYPSKISNSHGAQDSPHFNKGRHGKWPTFFLCSISFHLCFQDAEPHAGRLCFPDWGFGGDPSATAKVNSNIFE